MVNEGVAPPDLNTEIGRIRATIGDTIFEPIEDKPGYGTYNYFSDLELSSFIATTPEALRATGLALYQRAHAEATKAVNMATDDLRLNTVSRSEALRLLGDRYIERADEIDRKAAQDVFRVVPFRGRRYGVV